MAFYLTSESRHPGIYYSCSGPLACFLVLVVSAFHGDFFWLCYTSFPWIFSLSLFPASSHSTHSSRLRCLSLNTTSYENPPKLSFNSALLLLQILMYRKHTLYFRDICLYNLLWYFEKFDLYSNICVSTSWEFAEDRNWMYIYFFIYVQVPSDVPHVWQGSHSLPGGKIGKITSITQGDNCCNRGWCKAWSMSLKGDSSLLWWIRECFTETEMVELWLAGYIASF
jgi:hypothetical protein